MATKKIWLPQDIYQIKVTLRYTRPPIWRRLLVPAGLTLDALHDVLQGAMGWDDSHLHEFRIGQRRFGKPDPSVPSHVILYNEAPLWSNRRMFTRAAPLMIDES